MANDLMVVRYYLTRRRTSSLFAVAIMGCKPIVTRRHSRDGLDCRDPAPTGSLDDLIGREKDKRSQGEAEGLRGCAVDEQPAAAPRTRRIAAHWPQRATCRMLEKTPYAVARVAGCCETPIVDKTRRER